MITKHYEFVCEECGNADYPPGKSIKQCIKYWRENNGIFTADEEVFCNKDCLNKDRLKLRL